MKPPTPKIAPLYLKIPALEVFGPLAAAFVTHGAKGLGLADEAAEEIGLAAEEVIATLARLPAPGREVEVRCVSGSHFIRTDFILPVRDLPLRALNMTATIRIDGPADDATGLDQMGLLIASRMADRFYLTRQGNGNLVLTLIKERVYPEMDGAALPDTPKPVTVFRISEPDPGQIKWFLRRVCQRYSDRHFPMAFRYPGKVVDRVAAQDFHILLALGPDGELGGGLAWCWEGRKTIEMFGPYVFHPASAPDMGQQLMDTCIGKIARTSALVLIHRMPTPELPEGYLEPLAALPYGIEARDAPLPYFRMMHEDSGAVAWVHPLLIGFLKSTYARLVFPREIQPVLAEGESQNPDSVLSLEMDRNMGRATLRPVWPGSDRVQNLTDHLHLLEHEAMVRVIFEMDLGLSWQAEFTPGLLQLGFSPTMILPHAGVGDLILFEKETVPA